MRRENAKSSDEIDATDSPEEGGFFRRWSARKRRARRGQVEDAPTQASARTAQASESDAATEPQRVLTDEDMPPLETLNEDSDFSGFMSPGVSESLRNLALRKMFLSAKYNVTDGLDDYAEDFTKFEPLGDVITSDMRHQMEMQAERAKEKLEDEARAAMDETPGDDEVAAESGVGEAREGGGEEKRPETLAREDSDTVESANDISSDDDIRGS